MAWKLNCFENTPLEATKFQIVISYFGEFLGDDDMKELFLGPFRSENRDVNLVWFGTKC
jgi:hypothetical protein